MLTPTSKFRAGEERFIKRNATHRGRISRKGTVSSVLHKSEDHKECKEAIQYSLYTMY